MTDTPEELTNWGRWGSDDELGTLNFITDTARARGVMEAKLGNVVTLGVPLAPVVLSGGGPAPQHASLMPAAVLQMTQSAPLGVTDVLVINTHHLDLTHIDALMHISDAGNVYPGIPIDVAVAGGTVKHSSTTPYTKGIVTRGLLLDLSPGSRLEAGYEVTYQDLEQARARSGLEVESGDALVVRGGWVISESLETNLPVMTADAVRWMAEKEISVFAGDIGDRLPRPPITSSFAMHQIALAKLGLPIINGAGVESLASTCEQLQRWSFLFVIGAPPITNATALPVSPLAIF
jgi:kynurenine formamidase